MTEAVWKLKPCPFCGGKAQMLHYRTMRDGHFIAKYYVECTMCHIEMPTCLSFESEEETAEAWNRRTEK